MCNARSALLMVVVTTLATWPGIGIAAKGGGNTTSGIGIQQLAIPSGAAQAMATGINEQGTVIVGSIDWKGDQYWYFAARWRRPSAGSAWQAEDLRPYLPTARTSAAILANDAGTVVVRSEFLDSTQHRFVITSFGQTVEIASHDLPRDLSEMDEMVGVRSGEGARPDWPIYWTSPTGPVVELPVLEDGYGGVAAWFQGSDIIGTLGDVSGNWLVRWTRTSGEWRVARIVKLPPGYEVSSMNSSGRIAVNVCESYACTERSGAVWDPPYDSPPIYLARRGGTSSNAGRVLEDGRVIGTLVTSSGWVAVLWPALNTLTEFPTLSHTDSTFLGDANEFKQAVGYLRLYAARQFQYVAVLWTLP